MLANIVGCCRKHKQKAVKASIDTGYKAFFSLKNRLNKIKEKPLKDVTVTVF